MRRFFQDFPSFCFFDIFFDFDLFFSSLVTFVIVIFQICHYQQTSKKFFTMKYMLCLWNTFLFFNIRFWFATKAAFGILFIMLEYELSTNSTLAAKRWPVYLLNMSENHAELFQKCKPSTIFLLKQIQRKLSGNVYEELIKLFVTELPRLDATVWLANNLNPFTPTTCL